MATSKAGEKPAKPATKPATKPAKPAAAKTAPKAKTAAAPAAKKAASAPKPARKAAAPKLAADQRRYYVEVAAYYIAERRGFHGGSQLNDWVEAEKEIDRLLKEGILKP